MKPIIIKSQAEFDALPESFDKYTVIIIDSYKTLIIIKKHRKKSLIRVVRDSRVETWGDSRVYVSGNVYVRALDNSRVDAGGNSVVDAMDESRIVAGENSDVHIWHNATATGTGKITICG